MSCDLINNHIRRCKTSLGGVDTVYLFKFKEVSRTVINIDELDRLISYPQTTITRIDAEAISYTETPTDNRGAVSYDQRLTFQVPQTDFNNELPKLMKFDVVAIFKDRNGFTRIMGLFNGCSSVVTNTTGTERNSLNGYNVTITGTEDNQAYYIEDLTDAGFVTKPDPPKGISFAGLGMTRIYSAYKTDIAQQNNYAELQAAGLPAGSGTNIVYGPDGLPDFSAVGLSSTLYYEKIFCQITGDFFNGLHENETDANQWCRALESGVVDQKNGLPAYYMTGYFIQGVDENVQGLPLPELEIDNNPGSGFSYVFVASNDNIDSDSAVFYQGTQADAIIGYASTNQVPASGLVAQIQTPSTGGTINLRPITSETAGQSAIIIVTVDDATKTVTAYRGTTQEDQETYIGAYPSLKKRLGARRINQNALKGHINFLGVADRVWNETERERIVNNLTTIFGL